MMEPIKIILELRVIADGSVTAVAYAGGEERIANNNAVPTTPIPTTIETRLRCLLWYSHIGDKPSESCEGCKVACPVKGRYKGEEMTI